MRRAALLALLVALLFPAGAAADGDPASDVLLGTSVFYPYSPATPLALQRALNAEAAAAQKAGLGLKIALIGSPVDLGAIPELFAKPAAYAKFLDQEISFHAVEPLLVVMPNGYGTWGLAPAAGAALAGMPAPGRGSTALARAALAAVPRIVRATGHRLGPGTPAAGRASGGSSVMTVVVIALVAAAILTSGALVAVRRRDRASHRSG